MDKSFEQEMNKLYNDYDEAKKNKDTKKMDIIRKLVDSKSINEGTSIFQPYPDHRNKKFQSIIYHKKEFYSNQLFLDTSGIEPPCNTEFSIKGHQSFLKNFMTKESPYKSLLIYHGVGVGKTCSGLTIAENFRDPLGRKEKRIIILSSKNIQIGWKKTIYDPDKQSNQCTGETYINSGAKTDREVNKLVKQYYEIMAYQSFSNFVKRLQDKYTQRLPDGQKEQGKKDCINEYFSNRYMVIDEVHNIRDEQGSDMRTAVKTIEDVIKYSTNLRLVLLTATPMYNRVTEILWILNMMLLNDKRPTIDKKEVFDKDELTKDGIQLIKEKCRGYVSYLRGENPITFPIRLYPSQLQLYSKNQIITNTNKPSLNLVGGKIKEPLQFLELFGSRMNKNGLQLQIYKKAVKELLEGNPDIDIDMRGEQNPILDNMKLTQISNIVYPVDKEDLSLDEYYGEKGLNNCMKRSGSKYSYKKNHERIFDVDNLSNYSSKLENIIKSIFKAKGIVFIYTNFINAGIIPLQLALEHNGYSKHTGEPILKYPNWVSESDKLKTKREPRSFNGLKKSQVSDKFIQGKYMVIDGSTSKNDLQDQLKIVNSKDNKYGEKIKIIIGTVVASEGLDFKRIRSVHIVDPWLHLNRIEQTVGRAIRYCSHADLPDNEKNVLIYLHVSTLPKIQANVEQESIDMSMYRYAEKKSIEIGKVENVLKMNAIDRYLFKDVNVIKKGTIQLVKMQPPLQTKEIVVDPSDKSYSKVCSYSDKCDYYKDVEKLIDLKMDDDTFIDTYSSTCIYNLKKKIALLYKEFFVYDLDSILGLLDEYGFNQTDMIYLSLNEMIIHKFIVHDKYGHSGYLINSNNYYIFQPLLFEDEKIPLYYRMNLLENRSKSITLPKLDVVVDVCNCNKRYSIANIEGIYTKLINEFELYETDINEPDALSVLDLLKDIYKDLHKNHIVIIGYLFDRLQFEDKCKLMYGTLHQLEFNQYDLYENLHTMLQSYIIYKSNKSEEYYLGDAIKNITDISVFGFVLNYNDKPCFYEYYKQEIIPCNQIQIINIHKSFKVFSKTKQYNEFKKSTDNWGYTVMRTKDYKKECVLKFVQPSIKGKIEKNKYPPGPGNVCIESNRASRIDNLIDIINKDYSELNPLLDIEMIKNKKNTCFLLEIALRYNKLNAFYPYDKIWFKYI